jgi:hypothetical protein
MRPFQQGIDSLMRSVGTGHIVAGCTVNQPYAQNQHQTDHFRHTNGRSHYLGGPLFEHAFELVESVARGVITPFGSTIDRRMIDVAESMARFVMENAPKDTGQLSLSGNPWVKSHGVLIYDRPPLAPREAD